MSYVARYKDSQGAEQVRKFFASHITQAHRKAQGIARSNKWILTSVGSA